MRSLIQTSFLVFFIGSLFSCTGKQDQNNTTAEPTLIEVRAVYDSENDQHLFQTETDTVSAGWTTFRFINSSPMIHFLFLDHMPGDRTSKELMNEISPVFQKSADLIEAGKMEEGMSVFAELPEWFEDLVYRGGPGFVSSGQTTEVTLFLEPGNYVMECYIKTADGTYHLKLGMLKDLRVMEDTTGARPPEEPTIDITITDEGFDVEGDLIPGKHLVAVHFEEENPAMLGKDVHVIRIEEGTNFEEISDWMDFTQPGSLISTAENPGPATFLGGVHEMPKGNTAYFTIDLQPGNYAWISEQPVTDAIYKEFTIGSENGAGNNNN